MFFDRVYVVPDPSRYAAASENSNAEALDADSDGGWYVCRDGFEAQSHGVNSDPPCVVYVRYYIWVNLPIGSSPPFKPTTNNPCQSTTLRPATRNPHSVAPTGNHTTNAIANTTSTSQKQKLKLKTHPTKHRQVLNGSERRLVV
jgi:hypothetical protein